MGVYGWGAAVRAALLLAPALLRAAGAAEGHRHAGQARALRHRHAPHRPHPRNEPEREATVHIGHRHHHRHHHETVTLLQGGASGHHPQFQGGASRHHPQSRVHFHDLRAGKAEGKGVASTLGGLTGSKSRGQNPNGKEHQWSQADHGSDNQERFDKLVLDKIGGNYSKDSRPLPDCSTFDCTHRIKIFMGVAFRKLIELDQVTGTFSMVVWVRLTWPDYRLIYNATEYFGDAPASTERKWNSSVDFVPLNEHLVWLPDIQLMNSVSPSEVINGEPRVFWFDEEKLRTEGYNMVQVTPQVIHAACTPDLTDFPFDTQHCKLAFGDWSASERYFEFDSTQIGHVDFDMSEANKEFDVVAIEAMHTDVFESGPFARTNFPNISYTLSLRRYSEYYMLVLVLPMLLLVLAGQAAYWMDMDGERFSHSITVILTVMAVASFTAGLIPKAKESMWLETFQTWCYILSSFPLFISILIDHARQMKLCRDVWIMHADMICRCAHPLLVGIFYCERMWHIPHWWEQSTVMIWFVVNILIFLVFAGSGIMNFIQFLGRLRRDLGTVKMDNVLKAYAHIADEDLREPEG